MQTAGVFDIPGLRPLGRFQPDRARLEGALPLFWAGSGLELRFSGEELHLALEADFGGAEPWIAVEVDGAPLIRMPLNRGMNDVCVLRGTADGTARHVRLVKECQPMADDPRHRLWVRELRWKGGAFLPLPEAAYRLEFVGDSLTSGEGVVGAVRENAWVPAVFSASGAWACRTARLLDAEARIISQSGWGVRSGWDNDPRHALPDWYERVCGPAMGEADRTMGAQEENDFSAWQPHAVIVNLGTNDANAMNNAAWEGPEGPFRQERGPEGLGAFEEAAAAFLKRLRRCNPGAKLVWAYGMAEDSLRPQLEQAVARYREETGDEEAYFLPLPAVRPETMGSRQHPGPLCHEEAAQAAAAFLRSIL